MKVLKNIKKREKTDTSLPESTSSPSAGSTRRSLKNTRQRRLGKQCIGKDFFAEYFFSGTRQRLTAVSSGTAADGPLPRAPFAECVTLGKLVFAECLPVPSVQHSVKGLFAESLTLPRAALGKAFFAECPTKSTRQRIQHSAKPRIPVVHAW
jgi:hypothetical protein